MGDLTVLAYSALQKPEPFASNIRAQLLKSVSDIPIISITLKPFDFGEVNLALTAPISTYTLYRQVLLGAKLAKTKWIAMGEDDCLYPSEHYQWIPPRDDTFYFNKNRWWIEKEGLYRWRDRTVLSACVCSRELMVETLETRFAKFPDHPETREGLTGWAEPSRYEFYLGLPKVKGDTFRTEQPIVTFNSKPSLGGLRRTNPSDIIKPYLEPWGTAEKVWQDFHS